MITDEAIRILDPKTTAEALAKIEYYGGFSGKEAAIKAVEDACILAVEALERSRWIPVGARMPEKNVPVLGWYKDNPFASYCPEVVSWNGKGWVFVYAQRYVTAVTHWMPLPEQPERGDGGGK